MLTPYKISAYCQEFKPQWASEMPAGCPPEDVMVPSEHPFFRLVSHSDTYTADDLSHMQKLIQSGTGVKDSHWQWDCLSLIMKQRLART